jgi:hypothetical protein
MSQTNNSFFQHPRAWGRQLSAFILGVFQNNVANAMTDLVADLGIPQSWKLAIGITGVILLLLISAPLMRRPKE